MVAREGCCNQQAVCYERKHAKLQPSPAMCYERKHVDAGTSVRRSPEPVRRMLQP